MVDVEWGKVTRFFDSVIEEANSSELPEEEIHLEVFIVSEGLGRTMRVIVPSNRVEDFMKNLGLWEATVFNGNVGP